MSSVLDPTSMTLLPLTTPAARSEASSRAMPLMMSFCADCGTPHIRSRWAFSSSIVASWAKDTSSLALLNTTTNSTCSGISHSSSAPSPEPAAAASAGASVCEVLSFSAKLLLSIPDLTVPLDTSEFGSRFSLESPFSEASK